MVFFFKKQNLITTSNVHYNVFLTQTKQSIANFPGKQARYMRVKIFH